MIAGVSPFIEFSKLTKAINKLNLLPLSQRIFLICINCEFVSKDNLNAVKNIFV